MVKFFFFIPDQLLVLSKLFLDDCCRAVNDNKIIMEELLEDWKKNSENRKEENFRFLRSLKNCDRETVDKLANQVHNSVFNQIDCRQCANCCKTSKPTLTKTDIQNIANFLSTPTKQIKDEYMEIDEDGDWTFNNLPCPFLKSNNECGIYDARPTDCREFPHTNKSGFSSRSHQTSYLTTSCPAAFEIVERMKLEMKN